MTKGVILKYLKNDKLKKEVKKLYHEKKVGNILFYKKDFNIKRYIKIKYLFLSNYIRYKKYY